jgi:hypothetical protein
VRRESLEREQFTALLAGRPEHDVFTDPRSSHRRFVRRSGLVNGAGAKRARRA